MPEEQATPTPAVAPPVAPPAPDVQRQLGALADAVKQLAESQTTLLHVLGKQAGGAANAPAAPTPAPTPPPPPADIGGDPGEGGVRPSAVVDYSKLTPLQQIAVGLRDAKPQGPGVLRRSMTARDDTAAPNGAD